MKKTFKISLFIFACLCGASHATITLNTFFGIATSSDGVTPVPDDTLWIMIVDRDGNNVLPGGLEADSSLNQNVDTSQIADDFSNIMLSLGATINGDVIFAMGGMNGTENFGQAGISNEAIELGLGESDILGSSDVGKTFGFYWFPGIAYDSGNPNVQLGSVFEVGGISTVNNLDAGDPMVIPGDGITINIGASTEELGGTTPSADFTALAIPEPSTLVLSLVGAVALLRRRRV